MKYIMAGTLYLCATPIGNLDDITFRVVKLMESVDVIAAEDTRNTLKLLNHFEIKTPMTSYHEHNKVTKGPVLVERMLAGESIALVTDAGMPGISDPGADLVKLCYDAGVPVTVAPGASAAVVALVLSGLDTRRFVFEGFLPPDKKERRAILKTLEREHRTMIFYEAPHRLTDTLEELAELFKGRKGIHVYAHHIFKGNEAMADSHTEEEWAERTQAMIRLEDKIRECGLESKAGISKSIKLNHCMADSGRSVTILPDGHIGLCEHFSEDEFIGHIDREGFDEKVVQSWKERMPEIPECAECVLYPECIQLKKCPNGGKCFPALREERIRKIKRQMLNEYERWKSQQNTEETDEDELC